MKLSLFAFFAILLSVSASFSASTMSLTETSVEIQKSPGNRPTPLPSEPGARPVPAPGFKFAEGKVLWDRSSMPTEVSLVSRWMMIGYADVDIDFAQFKNQYRADGLKNADCSKLYLTFGNAPNPVTGQNILTSLFSHWGRKDVELGPYESSIDSSVQSAVASVFAQGGAVKSFYRLDCRTSLNSIDELVCGLTFKLDPSEKGHWPKQDVYDNVMGGVVIFKRAN